MFVWRARKDGVQGKYVSKALNTKDHSNFCSPKLLSLNLSSNKLFQLDSLFDVVKKAPKLKILNLSKNMVRRRDWG